MDPISRVILHIDLDAFFAAAEVVANPSLRGKPVVVGGRPGERATVACASYEARALGIYAGMSLMEAARAAPCAVFLPCSPTRYLDLSIRMLRILLRLTPLVEPASIDEAYLDVGDIAGTLEEGDTLARSIQEEIERTIGLTSSAGIGPNKRIAKAASSVRKPCGRTTLNIDSYRSLFYRRSVSILQGVGKNTGDLLGSAGIRSVGDLAAASPSLLRKILGRRGPSLGEAARGDDASPVVPVHSRSNQRSLGHQFTLPKAERNREAIRRVILSLSDAVALDLRDEGWTAHTIRLGIMLERGRIRGKQCRIGVGTSSADVIFGVAGDMFRDMDEGGDIRRVVVSVSELVRSDSDRRTNWYSESLFSSSDGKTFERLSDSLRSRFGGQVLRRASLLGDSNGGLKR